MTVLEAFKIQSEACARLGSPFMARLMQLFAERLQPGTPVADCVLNWSGDPSPSADSVPLRLSGALHALRLDGMAFQDTYPPAVVPDERLWDSVEQALEAHSARILGWLESPPQTNEVRRGAVVLAAMALLDEKFSLPISMMELGASAGLNLRSDQFSLTLPSKAIGPDSSPVQLAPKWSGVEPPARAPTVVMRQGVDLSPLDPLDPDDQLRLLAYLWPDQPDRLARTRGAIELAASHPAHMVKADAAEWLNQALKDPQTDTLRIVYHTIARQYFDATSKKSIDAAMEEAGAQCGATNPLAYLSMEADGEIGAALQLTIWPDGHLVDLGRADFHGRWVGWKQETL